MIYIVLYNTMVIALTVSMIVVAFKLKRIWKYIISPFLIFIVVKVFIWPNIDYLKSPFAEPFKVVVTENGKPVSQVTVITARGLEFTSFFAHIPEVVWKDVGISSTRSNGEVEFGRELKYMTIDLGLIGNWHDNNDIFYSCVKNGYRYVSAITEHNKVILVQTDKNIKGTGYYDGINKLELDKRLIFSVFSRKARLVIDSYLTNSH